MEEIILGNRQNAKNHTPENKRENMDAVIKNKIISNSLLSNDCKIGKYTVKEILDAIIAHGITP